MHAAPRIQRRFVFVYWLQCSGHAIPSKLLAENDSACRACQLWLTLNLAQIAQVKSSLDYDKRAGGSRGQAWIADIPLFGLRKGDRLEPCPHMPDTGAIDTIKESWRVSNETWAIHRNPLFSAETDIDMECLSVDWLHTLSLGIFQDLLGLLVWALMEANVWRVGGARDARLQLSVNRLDNELFRFYREQAQQGIQHSRAQRLEPQMCGSADAPRCGLHGGETNCFLAFSL